jgi:hypothetical protein
MASGRKQTTQADDPDPLRPELARQAAGEGLDGGAGGGEAARQMVAAVAPG